MKLSPWRTCALLLACSSIVAAAKGKSPIVGEPHNHTDMDFWNCPSVLDGSHSEVIESCVDFDPFGDLESDKYDENFSGDLAYFEFTDANINASRVIEWYKEYSIKYQNTSFWREHGEWATFLTVFTHNTNLDCPIASAECNGVLERETIQKKFPHKPELTRRVHFVLEMFKRYHSLNYHKLNAFNQVHNWLVWKISEIVTTAQQMPDNKAEGLCQLVHQIIDTAVQIALSIVTDATQGLAKPIMDEIPDISGWIWETWSGPLKEGEKIPKWIETTQGFLTRFDLNGITSCLNSGGACFQSAYKIQSYLTGPVWAGQVTSMDSYVQQLIWGVERAGPLSGLEGGTGTDPICASFGGGMSINVEANIDAVQKVVVDQTEKIGKMIVGTFEMLYNGNVTAPGDISLTAFAFGNQQWEGVGSIIDDMKNANHWLDDLKKQTVMQMASLAAAHDHSYVKCTHIKQAGNMCARAANAQPCAHGKDCYRGVFCPKPSADPDLVCRAAKWWPSILGGYEAALPSLEKWEDFMGGRFELTRGKVLQSTWLWYEEFGNKDDAFQVEWGSKDSNVTNLAGGFHVPLCYRPNMDIMDGKFPTTCGKDWRASETADFIKALNMDHDSQIYHDIVFGMPNALFRGYWPKYVRENSATMAASFNNLCALNIRLGNKHIDKSPNIIDENYRIHMEKDPSCEIVQNAISNMTLMEATEWFCRTGAKEHGVFDHELPYIILWRTEKVEKEMSHHYHCKRWRKKYPVPLKIGSNSTLPSGSNISPDTNSTLLYESTAEEESQKDEGD